MNFLLLLLVLILIGTNVYTVSKLNRAKKLPVDSGNPTPAIAPSNTKAIANPKHQLTRTFVNRRMPPVSGAGAQDFHGWHFVCSCGTIAPASDNQYQEYGAGSESGAVKGWHEHASLYAELVDGAENELEKVKKELQEHKDSCICRDL